MIIDLAHTNFQAIHFANNDEWLSYMGQFEPRNPPEYNPEPRTHAWRFPCIMIYDEMDVIRSYNGNDCFMNFFIFSGNETYNNLKEELLNTN